MTVSLVVIIMADYASAVAQDIRLPERWLSGLSDIRPLHNDDTLTIRILGDVMMHSLQIEDALQSDSSYRFRCFDMIKAELTEADIAIANMEFTLAGGPYSGYPRFSAPDAFADYLAECGFDIFLTANNHILDKGSEGAARTIKRYGQLETTHGIRYTGIAADDKDFTARNPLMIRKKGFRTVIMNFTYGTNLGSTAAWPEVNYISEREKIRNMSEAAHDRGADILMAFPHWGNEYQLKHSQAQEKAAAMLAESGTDIIIGSHPHVVQDFQQTGGIPVAYSLGNAVSNMSAPNTQIGLMATVRITRDGTGKAYVLPVEFTYLWCSRPGGFTDTYMVLPVKEAIGTRSRWAGCREYDKMIDTYYRVMSETGIKDNTYNE